jgi:transcriptional regulator
MYLPEHFRVDDRARLFALMRAHPLALLIVAGEGGVSADPIPFLADESANMLRAHVARANPVWTKLEAGGEALVVFQGHGHYVSPDWYPTKQETGKVVPTWNYAMVEARGAVRVIHDPQWLRGLVGALTDVHEGGREKPWRVEDAPDDFVASQLRAIVGVEIAISKLTGKFKLSQNRVAKDRQAVLAELEARGGEGDRAMAALMRATGKD